MPALVLALASILIFTPVRPPQARMGHVRLCNPMLVELAREATLRSATFRRLEQQLDRSSVIVYVRMARCPHEVDSCLHFLSGENGVRTLRISIKSAPRSPAELAGLLAHELYHAAEIAGDPEIVDLASFCRFFARAGWQGVDGYETRRGRVIARHVEREYLAPVSIHPTAR